MTDAELLDGIQSVTRLHLDGTVMLAPDTPLVPTLGLDSLRMLTLVVELENRFQVNLEEGDEAQLVVVGDLVALLRRRMAER